MKNYILKWLGLDTLTAEVETLKAKNAYLSETLNNIEATVNEMEEPDMSDYISESDINDRIETYCNDYDIPNKDWIEGELDDKVKEAIDNAGIEEQVRDLFNDASPAPMSIEDIKAEIAEQVKKAIKPKAKAKPKKK